ncbi:hypothetical protein, partial [Tritonibacter aquimaris]|uniref:hypothetical protein n=1 Tax=Tritonibacter aquimaris TaxID=2663379 RepID=UPI001BE3E0A7
SASPPHRPVCLSSASAPPVKGVLVLTTNTRNPKIHKKSPKTPKTTKIAQYQSVNLNLFCKHSLNSSKSQNQKPNANPQNIPKTT